MTEAYPLAWPLGWQRTRSPQRSNFTVKSLEYERRKLFDELRRLKARDIVLSTNIELRRDGMPYSGRRAPVDQGVAVYFTRQGKQQCIPCDKWFRVEENVKAITKSIDALRGLNRWGADQMVDAAFSGFKSLPAGSQEVECEALWHEVLEVSPNASQEEIKAAYRRLSKETHPDVGGNPDHFQLVQRAYEQAGV